MQWNMINIMSNRYILKEYIYEIIENFKKDQPLIY